VDLLDDVRSEIRRHGPDLELMTALAQVYLANNLFDLALGWVQKTIRIQPKDVASWELVVSILEKLDRPGELISAFQDYLNLEPGDRKRRRRFAQLLMDQERYAVAATQLRILLSTSPANKKLRKNLAHCCLMSEAYAEAAILYRELLADDPDSLAILRALVLCLDRSDQVQEAIRLLTTAVPHFKEDAEVLLPLGVLLIKEKKYLEAQTILRKVLATDPKNWRAHHNLARAYQKTGQKSFAKRFFQNAERYQAQNQKNP
jgi:tetratricopeptide (TPR) repeat protein